MRYKSSTFILGIVAGMLIAPDPVDAQGILDRARQRVTDRVVDRADQGVARAIDGAENAIVCAATDRECIAAAQADGREVVDDNGNAIQAVPATAAAGGPAGGSTAGGSTAATLRPGEGAWANYDFLPGERVLIAENFAADRVGNFPRRLELLEGNMQIVEWQGQRWLRVDDEGRLKIPLPETLPERFTVEFDLPLPWTGVFVHFGDGESRYSGTSVQLSGADGVGLLWANGDRKAIVDPRTLLPGLDREYENAWLAQTVRARVQVDGSYFKVYINEHRVANVPNAGFTRANYLTFEFADNTNGTYAYSHLLTNLSINAGGREMYEALLADGRVATQGIFFDTGSDRIRPESTPTLTEITAMLNEHADLRLMIEGHTDNTGQAASNQTLSEARAAAVKAYLVQQGVAAARLNSTGLGQTVPAKPNDTPEGRQQNRRVELVKMN